MSRRDAVRRHVPHRRVGHRSARRSPPRTWNQVRDRRGRGHYATGEGKALKDARWSLWKNPENLTDGQRDRLAYIAATHPRLHRAWSLKEGLRVAVTGKGAGAVAALDRWISWAQRCRIPSFVRLGQRIRNYRPEIVATIEHRLTNALVESFNTKIRLITRRAFGFHRVDVLIALTRLTLSGQRPRATHLNGRRAKNDLRLHRRAVALICRSSAVRAHDEGVEIGVLYVATRGGEPDSADARRHRPRRADRQDPRSESFGTYGCLKCVTAELRSVSAGQVNHKTCRTPDA